MKATRRPVTQASTELARMRAGEMTFEDLVKLWVERNWDPCPHATTPDEVYAMDDAGELFGGEGTWDELESMHAYGELSDGEYNTISGAKDTYARALGAAAQSSGADPDLVVESAGFGVIKYFTVPDRDGSPRMLVRLNEFKTQEYITADHPLWRSRSDLADLAWDSSGDNCTPADAAKLARSWGAEL